MRSRTVWFAGAGGGTGGSDSGSTVAGIRSGNR
jgi:hypothetical protein